MAYGFGLQKAGNRHNVGQGPVRLLGPSASRNLYGRPCLQGPSCGMVAAKSSMNFCQKLPSFLFGDAPMKDSGRAFLIKLSLMDFLGFRAPHNATCLILVLREFLPI